MWFCLGYLCLNHQTRIFTELNSILYTRMVIDVENQPESININFLYNPYIFHLSHVYMYKFGNTYIYFKMYPDIQSVPNNDYR